MAAARKGHQLRFSGLGHGFGAGIGLQLIVITVDHQHRTADPAIHRLAHIELRYNRPRLHDPGQHGAGGFASPFDAVLNLLGRVWIAEDVANEKFCKVGIVGQPVLAVVLVPTVKLLLFGHKMRRRHVGVARPDSRRGSGQDNGCNALRMMRRDHARNHAAKGKPYNNRVFRVGRIHHRKQIGDVVVQAIRRHFSRPVGLPVAAAIVSDAAKPLAKVRQLRLVYTRMNDAPRWHEDHGLRAVAVHLIVQLHAITIDKPILNRQLCTHDVTGLLNYSPRCE